MTEENRDAVLPSGTTEITLPDAQRADGEPGPVIVRTPLDVRNVSVTTIAVLSTILVLQYAQVVLIPIVIGVLIAYALAPLVGGLERMHVTRSVGAGVAVTLFVAALGLGAYMLSDDAMNLINSVPQAAQRLRERVRAHREDSGGALQQVQRAATEIDKAAVEATATAGQKPAPSDGVRKVEVVEPIFRASDYLWSGGMGLVNFLGQFAIVLFLVYFFLVAGDMYKRKLVKIAGPQFSQKRITVRILDDINRQIASFIRVQVLTSALVAVGTGIALWWFGLDQFILWGLLAGLFNSIPYLGPVLVTGGLGLVAFVQFDDIRRTLSVCLVALAITSLEGFLLTPTLMGRAARMNAVAVFLGLLFWSWIWGVWGTVLAVPMLMMLKAICDHVEDLQPVGELLGD